MYTAGLCARAHSFLDSEYLISSKAAQANLLNTDSTCDQLASVKASMLLKMAGLRRTFCFCFHSTRTTVLLWKWHRLYEDRSEGVCYISACMINGVGGGGALLMATNEGCSKWSLSHYHQQIFVTGMDACACIRACASPVEL